MSFVEKSMSCVGEAEVQNPSESPCAEVRPCRKCRGTDKYSTGQCKRCAKSYQEANREKLAAKNKAYREANRERLLAAQKARREADPERYKAARLRAYAADRERQLARCRAWREANPEKNRELQAAWRDANSEREAARNRKRFTGWAPEEFEAAWLAQLGTCAICKQSMQKVGRGAMTVAADHCHKTGKTRGLLCKKCNAGLGMFGDSPERVRAAVVYLEKHS